MPEDLAWGRQPCIERFRKLLTSQAAMLCKGRRVGNTASVCAEPGREPASALSWAKHSKRPRGKVAALMLCASGYLPPTQAALMGRGSSGWAALTQTRHLIRLHRRTIPRPRVLSRQNQCRRDMGVGSLGKGCDDIHLVTKQGVDGHRRGGKQRRTSRRLIWCAATQATQKAETTGWVGFGATAWWEIQESCGKRQA